MATDIYRLVMDAGASDKDIDSQRCASMLSAYQLVVMDRTRFVVANSNSCWIHSCASPATGARLESVVGAKVAADCN